MPSPVAQHALDRGFPSDLIFTPVKAGEVTTVTYHLCIWHLFFDITLLLRCLPYDKLPWCLFTEIILFVET